MAARNNIANIDIAVKRMIRIRKTAPAEAVNFTICPAKTFMRPDGLAQQGRSVSDHCKIVGSVAKAITLTYPAGIREVLFPRGSELAAAAHDIGKVSPYFLEKLRRKFDITNDRLPIMNDLNPSLENDWGGHAGVSQVTAHYLNAPKYVPEVLGQHHGFSPMVEGIPATAEKFGGKPWLDERVRLIDHLKQFFGTDWPKVESHSQSRVIAGLTTVADWIGSSSHFENPDVDWEPVVDKALAESGFIPAKVKQGLSFKDVFGFDPRGAQQVLIDQVTGPGIYVLEGQMGLGKTEAALFCAYKLLEQNLATGIYFALPTQLTSNKIFDRFNPFLDDILDPECKHRSLLLHGTAKLLEKADMGEEGKPGGSWFNHSKRGILAPFAVGTLDQALMAAMNVKHGFVRSLGLAGKVVILDEVHTYDSYTGTILDSLVDLLKSIHCTVIILSATLNKDRREKIIGQPVIGNDYPLITSSPNGCPLVEKSFDSPETHQVRVKIKSSAEDCFREAVNRAKQGQQVLWIENTVAAAQSRYQDFVCAGLENGFESGLIHSKLTMTDRSAAEQKWVELYGKPGWESRNHKGRVLIGTQVLEQSIDIDADFLVTALCPTDMLLQRIGRLWRHTATPRNVSASCETWVIAPELSLAVEDPEKHFGSTAYVYSPYVLCRTLEVWQDVETIGLPTDIRALIESTYSIRAESGKMAYHLSILEDGDRLTKGRRQLRQLALMTLSVGGKTMPEERAQTRYSEMQTVDVLLVQRIRRAGEEGVCKMTLLDGNIVNIPVNIGSLSKAEWRKISSILMTQVVKVRPNEATAPQSVALLKSYGLHHCFFLGLEDTDDSQIRVAIVDESDSIMSINGHSANDKYSLIYRSDLGYQAVKR